MCLKDSDGNYYDDNSLMFVLLHEIAHVICKSIGHTDEFHKIFEDLLKEAEKEKQALVEKEAKKYSDTILKNWKQFYIDSTPIFNINEYPFFREQDLIAEVNSGPENVSIEGYFQKYKYNFYFWKYWVTTFMDNSMCCFHLMVRPIPMYVV